jgi:PTH1 family peptidyl-tRNA hydrolase
MWTFFRKSRREKPETEEALPGRAPWILLPLGNPGSQYAATRHNLGRLLLQRWMDRNCPNPAAVHRFQTGTLYRLKEPFLALVPGTYMNLSGQVVGEALAAGFDSARLVVLYDDKDLPLGMGRFRLEGSAGGHNGVQSVIEARGSEVFARLRLGIGPFLRPLHQFVLQEWTPEEWDRIAAMDAPFDRFMELLASCEDLAALASQVNGQVFWKGPAGAERSIDPQGLP